MFLNLHGISKDFEFQQTVICQISSVVSIMVDISKLGDSDVIQNVKQIVDHSKNVLLIFTKEDKCPLTSFKQSYKNLLELLGESKKKVHFIKLFLGTRNKSLLQQTQEIKSWINKLTSQKDEDLKSLMEHVECLEIPNVKLDQDDTALICGKKAADDIYKEIKKYDIKCMKEKVMPLQCDTWKEWGTIEREMKRGKPDKMESQDHFIARLHLNQGELREEQINQFMKESSKVIPMFCSNIINLKGNCRLYFIQWLTYLLKEMSREIIPGLRQRLWSKRSDLNIAPAIPLESTSNAGISTLKSEVKELEKDIEKTSIGLKHFFREIGQIYEAFRSSRNVRSEFKVAVENLPCAVAELFMSGYTLEIVGSNMKQVPMLFIKSVFGYLKDMIK